MINPALKTFLSWCLRTGILTPLRLNDSDSYRYLACESELSPGSTVVSVPLECCLVADTLEALAERLVFERSLGPKSRYAPYIDILPKLDTFRTTMPSFWTQCRLKSVTDGGQTAKKMKDDYERWDTKKVDPWAMACVKSRANYLHGHGFSMTPLLDMFNHDCSVHTTARVEDGTLCLRVHRSFAAGDEVFISYGDLSNRDTLCDFGFVSLENPCNKESIEVKIIRKEPFTLTVSLSDGSIDQGSLSALRRYLATTEELQQQPDGAKIMSFTNPISERNELDVFSFIASELDFAAAEAGLGAAKAGNDKLVVDYLNARATTLRKGLDGIIKKYPLLEY